MSEYEKRGLGLIQSEPDPRDYVFGATYGAETLPESYQTDISGIKVHDQGEYQNCGTHALSVHVEIGLKKAGKYQKVSFPWYYGNRRYSENKGEGTEARGLLKAAQKDGGLYLTDYPYEEEVPKAIETFEKYFESFQTKAQNIRIKNYYQCNTVEEVKKAVYYYGSVLVGTIVFKSFYEISNTNPIMPEPRIDGTSLEPMAGGHMMLIVGWDKNGFTVLNSWGEGFGKKGLFTMPYSIVTWSRRQGFPLPLFEAWAVDGVYLNGKLLETGAPSVTPPTPAGNDGWYKQNGKWRYRENGKDVVGWKKVQNVWYYMNADGYMRVGWLKDGNKWYYLKANGAMATGWINDKNKWYYLKSDGAMATGWIKDKGEWYYLNPDGSMKTGWLQIGSRHYYCLDSGKAARGFHTIDGKDYYFAEEWFEGLQECQMIQTDSSGAIV